MRVEGAPVLSEQGWMVAKWAGEGLPRGGEGLGLQLQH